MSFSFIFFIIVHVLALAYFLEAMRRVRQRSKEYPLHESADTLPFRWVRLRHIVILYGLVYVAWVLVSLWLYFGWLQGGTAENLPPPPNQTILNL